MARGLRVGTDDGAAQDAARLARPLHREGVGHRAVVAVLRLEAGGPQTDVIGATLGRRVLAARRPRAGDAGLVADELARGRPDEELGVLRLLPGRGELERSDAASAGAGRAGLPAGAGVAAAAAVGLVRVRIHARASAFDLRRRAAPGHAVEAAGLIHAPLARGAGARPVGALVDVIARPAIARVARLARAGEAARRVGAGGVDGALRGAVGALVDVVACPASARVPALAGTGVAARRVGADGIHGALGGAVGALIDVRTRPAIARVARLARTGVAARRVGAGGVGGALRGAVGALVDVRARPAIARVPGLARAGVAARGVGAGGVGGALGGAVGALVDVRAGPAVARVARLADTGVAAGGVGAGGVGGALRGAVGALVDVRADAGLALTGIARLHLTGGATAVASRAVAVVTALARHHLAVAAEGPRRLHRVHLVDGGQPALELHEAIRRGIRIGDERRIGAQPQLHEPHLPRGDDRHVGAQELHLRHHRHRQAPVVDAQRAAAFLALAHVQVQRAAQRRDEAGDLPIRRAHGIVRVEDRDDTVGCHRVRVGVHRELGDLILRFQLRRGLDVTGGRRLGIDSTGTQDGGQPDSTQDAPRRGPSIELHVSLHSTQQTDSPRGRGGLSGNCRNPWNARSADSAPARCIRAGGH